MSPRRLAILAAENSWYFNQLEQAALRRGMQVVRRGFPDLKVRMSNAEAETAEIGVSGSTSTEYFTDSSPNLSDNWFPDFDTAIVRTMPVGSLEQVVFRMDVLRTWENDCVTVINSARCLETSIDKLLTLDGFQAHNIPFPTTFACQTADQAMESFDALGGHVVVKPIFGGEGRGIMRVDDPTVAYRVFKSLESIDSVIYCQQFVADVVKDIRILFVGEKSFSMLRSNSQSWISNASQGGSGESYTPSEEELQLAWRAAQSVGGLIVGVDILQDRDGDYFVLEVNAVPGWQLLEKVTGVQVADEVIETLASMFTDEANAL